MKIRSATAVFAAITAAAMLTACGAKRPEPDSPLEIINTVQTAETDAAADGSGAGGISIDAHAGTNVPEYSEYSGSSTDNPAHPAQDAGEEGAPSAAEAENGSGDSSVKGGRNVILVDNNECRATVTDYGKDEKNGYKVKLLFENKNMARDCLFAVERAYVDGVLFNACFAGTAAPGRPKEASVCFSSGEMEQYGIEDPSDIALYISASDPDYYNGEYIGETCHIYPGGYGKAFSYKYTVKDSDKVLAENESVSVILTGFSRDSEWDYFCADLCLVNKTNETLVFTADDVTVNGEYLDPYFSHTLDGRCTSFTKVMWPDGDISDLEPSRPKSIKAVFIAETEKDGKEKLREECALMP